MQTLKTIKVGKEEWDVFFSTNNLTHKKSRACLDLFGYGWQIPSIEDLRTIMEYHIINDALDDIPRRHGWNLKLPIFWSSSQSNDINYSYGWHAFNFNNKTIHKAHSSEKNNICFLRKRNRVHHEN